MNRNVPKLSMFGSPLKNPRVNSLMSTTIEEGKSQSQSTTGFIDLDKVRAID